MEGGHPPFATRLVLWPRRCRRADAAPAVPQTEQTRGDAKEALPLGLFN